MELTTSTHVHDTLAPVSKCTGSAEQEGFDNACDGLANKHEVLTFKLGGEEYGIDILCVQEIRSCEPLTRLFTAPPHVKGLMNLRGQVVPVVDLRMCLAVSCDERSAGAVVVLRAAPHVVGVLVDEVLDVTTLDARSIRPVPRVARGNDAGFVSGIASLETGRGAFEDATIGKRTIVLLDLAGLLRAHETGLPCEQVEAQDKGPHQATRAFGRF